MINSFNTSLISCLHFCFYILQLIYPFLACLSPVSSSQVVQVLRAIDRDEGGNDSTVYFNIPPDSSAALNFSIRESGGVQCFFCPCLILYLSPYSPLLLSLSLPIPYQFPLCLSYLFLLFIYISDCLSICCIVFLCVSASPIIVHISGSFVHCYFVCLCSSLLHIFSSCTQRENALAFFTAMDSMVWTNVVPSEIELNFT